MMNQIDDVFLENNFGSQTVESLDPELLRILDYYEFDTN
jgi:hypothetical protein